MNGTVRLVLTRFTDEALLVVGSASVLVLALIAVCWAYNRYRFRRLSHQIPAGVVRDYLDSIIQNSMSLKSSLFRGGGAGSEGVPSVLPADELEGGARDAEVVSLRRRLADSEKAVGELEERLKEARAPGDAEAEELRERNRSLEGELERLRASVRSGDGAGEEAARLARERDELKKKLRDYSIIDEDFANLKRLQAENDRLKASLEEARGGAPAPSPAADPPAPAPDAAPDAGKEPEGEPSKKAGRGEKSTDELLNEFEKMLG